MSAIPRRRSATDRAAPRISIGTVSAAEFFGLVPGGPIARGDISKTTRLVFVGLCILARGSRTWVRFVVAELMAAVAMSEKVVRQSLRELTSVGLIEWDSFDHQFRVLVRLRGPNESEPAPASPVLSHKNSPVWEPDPEPKPEPDPAPEPGSPLVLVLERENQETNETTGVRSCDSDSSEEQNPVSDDEIVNQAVEHALALSWEISPYQVLELIRLAEDVGGVDAVEYAIDICREMSPCPPWGYAHGIIKRLRQQARFIRPGDSPPAEPAAAQRGGRTMSPLVRRTKAAELLDVIERYGWELRLDGSLIRPVRVREDARPLHGLRDRMAELKPETLEILWERQQESLPPEKPPAAGSRSGKSSPPPDHESSGPSVSFYRESLFTESATEKRPAHPAPRASNPEPAPTAGASRDQTPDTPSRPAAGGPAQASRGSLGRGIARSLGPAPGESRSAGGLAGRDGRSLQPVPTGTGQTASANRSPLSSGGRPEPEIRRRE